MRLLEKLADRLPALCLFRTNPLPMWVVEPTTLRIVDANEAACKTYGFVHDDFLAMTFADLAPGAASRPSVEGRTATIQFQGRQQHRAKSDVHVEVEVTSETLAGELSGLVLVIARTVAEQMSGEELRSFQKSVLAAQSEASPDGILVIDPLGKIVSFNRRFVEMWRIPPDVVASRSDDLALGSVMNALADPDAFLGKVRYLYDHPDETSRDDVLLKDGRVFDRHSSPLRGEAREQYGRIWFFRDVTADRRADEHLRRSERLSLLGSLASGVAHEINNPLAYLLSNGEMTRDELTELAADPRLPGPVRAQCRELAELLAHSYEGLLHIKEVVASLRTLSRPSGPSRELVDLLPVAQTAITLASERAREKNVRVATDLLGTAAVSGRREEIAQVLLNLVLNAIDASPDGGTVLVAASDTPELVELRVHDTGAGIPAELQPRLFDPFFTTKPQGTGLGLAISQRIAHEHGGGLTFTSTPEGTTFRLRLPKRGAP